MRAIIPIYEEKTGLVLENQQACLDFLANNSQKNLSRLNIVSSGDAQRLMYGYANKKAEESIKEEQQWILTNIQTLNNELDFFLPGTLPDGASLYNLTSGEYEVKNNSINQKAQIIGYHRQKTRLLVTDEMQITGEYVEASFLMFKKKVRGSDCKIIVKSGSTLNLKKIIMDAISIVVEDGARLILSSVEFKGGLSAIIQKGTGVVEVIEKVSFTSVAHEYDFEEFSKETAINVIDYNKHKDIMDFIRKSKAKQFAIYENIDFRNESEIKFKSEIKFINPTTNNLIIYLNKAIVSSAFGAGEGIEVRGYIEVRDIEHSIISIKLLYGSIQSIESSNIAIRDTQVIVPSKEKGIIVDKSSIALINTTIEGEDKRSEAGCIAIELLDSKVELQNVIMQNLQDAFSIKREKRADEDEWIEVETGSSIYFNGLKITQVETVMHSLVDVNEIIGKLMIISDVHDAFILKDVGFKIKNLIMQNITGKALSFQQSQVAILGEATLLKNLEHGLELTDKTYAEVENGLFTEITASPAISIKNSIFIAHETRFKEVETAVHALEEGLFVNNHASFEAVKNPLAKAHGARAQMDYNEYLIEIGEGEVDEK